MMPSSSHQSLLRRTWRTTLFDVLKVLALVLITVFSTYTAGRTLSPLYFSSATHPHGRLVVTADYSFCTLITTSTVAACEQQIDDVAFPQAKRDCHGYLTTLQSCLDTHNNAGYCRNQRDNAESCLEIVTRTRLHQWVQTLAMETK
jgi:hypothetical protein